MRVDWQLLLQHLLPLPSATDGWRLCLRRGSLAVELTDTNRHTSSSDVENELSWWMKMSLTFTLIWLNVLSARQICFGAIWSVMTTQTTALTTPVIPYLFPLVHIQLLSWWIQLELVLKYKEILWLMSISNCKMWTTSDWSVRISVSDTYTLILKTALEKSINNVDEGD